MQKYLNFDRFLNIWLLGISDICIRQKDYDWVKIQIVPHTLERAKERGASEEEIRDVLKTGDPTEAM